MKRLVDINLDLLLYDFNYEESNNYSKIAFNKYNDNVIYIKKTPKYYFILLKGYRGFFGYSFKEDTRRVKRWFNLKSFPKRKGRIVDKKEFKLFEKGLILEGLK